jgi:hypothetical protein
MKSIPPDIRVFVDGIIAGAVRENFAYLTATEETARAEGEKFRAAFGRDLPGTYVEICKLCDGFTDDNMTRLHGLQTIWPPGEEFLDYEGLLEVHERQLIDGAGREDFIEFGNRDGVEPWGWDLTLDCFIRSDPNPLTGADMGRFGTFEDMFRALFRLTGRD